MNEIIKEKWLKALRGGTYIQGHDVLRDNGNFCCLGVLCDLYSKEEKVAWEDMENGEDMQGRLYLGEEFVLPLQVIKWAELDDGNPNVTIDDEEDTLAFFNDNDTNFMEIANLIEEQL